MIVDHENKLYSAIDALLQFFVAPYESMVDFGCGPGQHTRYLDCAKKMYVDAVITEDRPSPFVQMLEKDFWTQTSFKADVIIGMDFLEHLPKEQGYQFLIRAIRNSKLIILFSPEGWYEVPNPPNQFEMHQSAWTAKEMEELGFQVWLAPAFHPELGIGAFFAWMSNDGKFISAESIYALFGENR